MLHSLHVDAILYGQRQVKEEIDFQYKEIWTFNIYLVIKARPISKSEMKETKKVE